VFHQDEFKVFLLNLSGRINNYTRTRTPEAGFEMELKVNPDISSLFEGLEFWTYEALKQDIQQNGIRDALIVAQDGTVVCGHQRFKIAQELGIEPPFRVQHFASKQEMIEYAVNDNILRRHMNNYQKGLVALHYLPYAKKQARQRKLSSLRRGKEAPVKERFPERGNAHDISAKRVGLTGRTLQKVEYVESHGTNETKEKARSGELSVERAYSETRALEFVKPKVRVKIPREHFYTSKNVIPVKVDADYIVATPVPKDWYRGVRVTMEPLEKKSLIAKAKRELSEAQIKKALEEDKREWAEADKIFEELSEEENMEIERGRVAKTVKKKPEIEDSITIYPSGIKATFREEDKAKALYQELEPLLLKLRMSGKDREDVTTTAHELIIRYTTASSKREEIWFSKVTEFFKGKFPNIKVATQKNHNISEQGGIPKGIADIFDEYPDEDR